MFLGSAHGNTACGVWNEPGPQEIFCETIFILECIAPARLHTDRFLTPTPIRILINHHMQDISDKYSHEALLANVEDNSGAALMKNRHLKELLIPDMLNKSRAIAEKKAAHVIEQGVFDLEKTLGYEIDRLKTLKRWNPNIKEEEITCAEQEMHSLHRYIASAQLRMDSIKIIWKRPPERSSVN